MEYIVNIINLSLRWCQLNYKEYISRRKSTFPCYFLLLVKLWSWSNTAFDFPDFSEYFNSKSQGGLLGFFLPSSANWYSFFLGIPLSFQRVRHFKGKREQKKEHYEQSRKTFEFFSFFRETFEAFCLVLPKSKAETNSFQIKNEKEQITAVYLFDEKLQEFFESVSKSLMVLRSTDSEQMEAE